MDARALIRQSAPIDASQAYDAARLAGQTVVVTGGAHGLGAAMARAWAALGATVVVGAEPGDPGRQHFQHCDVTSWADQVALFDVARRLGPRPGIDVVVPCAGVLLAADAARFEEPRPGPDGQLAPPATTALAINAVGVAYTVHLALYHLAPPQQAAPGLCCILLVGSWASLAPLPGQAQYTMSKHAVAGLFRALRATTAVRYRIRVNMLCPYFIAAPGMLAPLIEAAYLAGGAGPARLADVVDAATRLVADPSVAGRALVVGPTSAGPDAATAAWECYAHDYEQVESFVARYLRLLDLMARAKGPLDWLRDVWATLTRRS